MRPAHNSYNLCEVEGGGHNLYQAICTGDYRQATDLFP